MACETQLLEKEFGRLTSPEYKYKQKVQPSEKIRHVEEEEPAYYMLLLTYLGYLIMIVCGHVQDYYAKVFHPETVADFMAKDGYAPLFSDFESFYIRRLQKRLRDCFGRVVTGVPGRYITVLDRVSNDYNTTYKYLGTSTDCLNLSSYNYLGFAQSSGQCTDAAEVSINTEGVSSFGARAVAGTLDAHVKTEQRVAEFLGKEDALVYSMGYGTNASVFSSLVDKHCLVLSDALNHGSIRYGARLSGAVIKIFKHNDTKDLERVLREQISQGQPKTHRPWKKILVAVEGLYSMEGTMTDLPTMCDLRDRYKFYLFVDEAHSIGALGPRGRGICDYLGVDPARVDILMGTFTKSFGATGGYIASSHELINHLRVNNMGNVYAESVSPPVLAQITAALQTIDGEIRPGEGEERLERIAFNSRYLRLALKRLGFIVYGIDDSPIIPVLLYVPAKMPEMGRILLKMGIAVVVVGYPATDIASSRARFCMSAALTKEDLDRIIKVMWQLGNILSFKYGKGMPDAHGKVRHWELSEVLATGVEDCKKDW
ncbi:Serine palmitoyltransferase 2 [Yarrowia sp. B02]|nr:Serine palmitoyltransferase 2 [Yarrowia sp. B02]